MIGKGCLWAAFVALAIVSVITLAATVWRSNNDWCDLATNALKCKFYEGDKLCYCIDTFTNENSNNDSRELGLYERSDQQCALLKGFLAVVDDKDLLIWLAKEMYQTGVDNALVALRKMGSKWSWMKDEVANEAEAIIWKKEFEQEPKDTNAMITVETVKVLDDDYEFKEMSLNYDHYLYFDKSYEWYGFRTSNNIFSIDKYFICVYDSESDFKIGDPETDDEASKKFGQNDRCSCSTSEPIQLSTADDSETFQSPGYPQNYCSDTNCRWIVSVAQGYAIKLDWLVFSTEFEMDMVYIYDGETDDSPLLATCTGSMCTDQQSSGNKMQIHFRSDHVTTDLGFRARVTGIETNPCFCPKSNTVSLVNLHDSHSLMSPQYPEPYCMLHNCGWTINAPRNFGLQIIWNKFATEINKDVVLIYDGDDSADGVLLMKCSGSSCDGIISRSNKIHIKFISDDVSSNDFGFKATVSVVQNYCENLEDRTDNGVVTYNTVVRSDGRIMVGSNATLTCAANSKISGTSSQTSDTATCHSPNWDKEFGTCEQACRIDLLEESEHYNNISYCKTINPDGELEILPSSGDRILVEQYDFINHATLNGPGELECIDGLWMPQSVASIQCVNIHPKILLIGGLDLPTLELYYPEDPGLNRVLDTKLSHSRTGHVSTLMPDGSVITAGGYAPGYIQTKSCERYYPKEDKMVGCPSLTTTRSAAAAATLGATPCICGGMSISESFQVTYLESCECLKSDSWEEITAMNTQRAAGLGLVVVKGKLLAIGGFNGVDYFASVEQFDPEVQQWSFVASMIAPRSYHGAAVLSGKVYICGGRDGPNPWLSSCEEYDIEKNIWSYTPQMREIRIQDVVNIISTGEVLVAVGGNINVQGVALGDSVEVYDPKIGKWKLIEKMSPRKEHSAVLIP